MKLALLQLVCIVSLLACGAGTPRGRGSNACTISQIPLQPPDSVPGWVYDPANVVRGTWIAGTYVRDVLVVVFLPGTDARARAEAICAVDGVVIGGQRWDEAEGLYFIRIPPDPTQQRMRRAVAILDALPQVILVTPEFVGVVEPAGG